MLSAVVVLAFSTGLIIVVGKVMGLTSAIQGGAFAGSLTSTPALAAATAKAGSNDPAVGYALTYPFGVVLTIVMVSIILNREWQSPKDPPSMAGQALVDLTIDVEHPTRMEDVPGFRQHLIRFSYLCRDGETRVVRDGEAFELGDRVVIIGPAEPVAAAIDFLGRKATKHLAQDRSAVDYRRILISNPLIAGRTIGSLDIPHRFARDHHQGPSRGHRVARQRRSGRRTRRSAPRGRSASSSCPASGTTSATRSARSARSMRSA